MRQLGMDLERRLVAPARMDEEEPFVARRAEDLEPRAAGLGEHRGELVAQRRRDAFLLSLFGMEADDRAEFHRTTPLRMLTVPIAAAATAASEAASDVPPCA